jgi:heme o synthase
VEITTNPTSRFKQFLALTKPRVTALAVFTAIIGMVLAVPAPNTPPMRLVVLAALGIWLLAASAFAVNCLLEAATDAKMKRTAWRASASGEITTKETIIFALILGALGSGILCAWVNTLTMLLTLLTFFGYAFIYTLWLKPYTPQNIVIGGASGAMPPVLGWAAVTGDVSPMAWVLVLIIFLWTPPHFWALALYRVEDYKKSGLPMLPVTHGSEYTRLHMLLYTVLTRCGNDVASVDRCERHALRRGCTRAGGYFFGLCAGLASQLFRRLGEKNFQIFNCVFDAAFCSVAD